MKDPTGNVKARRNDDQEAREDVTCTTIDNDADVDSVLEILLEKQEAALGGDTSSSAHDPRAVKKKSESKSKEEDVDVTKDTGGAVLIGAGALTPADEKTTTNKEKNATSGSAILIAEARLFQEKAEEGKGTTLHRSKGNASRSTAVITSSTSNSAERRSLGKLRTVSVVSPESTALSSPPQAARVQREVASMPPPEPVADGDMPSASQPGAFPRRGDATVEASGFFGVDNMVDQNVDDNFGPFSAPCASDVEAMNYHQGLVHARAVEHPEQTALPVLEDSNNLTGFRSSSTKQAENPGYKKMWLIAIILLVLGLAIGLPAGIALASSNEDKKNEDVLFNHTPAGNSTAPNVAPTEAEAGSEAFFLPIRDLMPNSTMDFIHNEVEDSPQYRAYKWLREDYKQSTYTMQKEQLLQRFILAIFYFATKGDAWKYKGGEGDIPIRTNFRPRPPPGSSAGSNHCDDTAVTGNVTKASNSSSGRWLQEHNYLSVESLDQMHVSDESSRFLRGSRQLQPPSGGQLAQLWINGTQAWLSHDYYECLWFSKTPIKGQKTCYEDGGYKNLALTLNELAGTIPMEIFLLTTLDSLSIGRNKIKGTIPTTIGIMPKLRDLRIFGNPTSGTIPSELGLLSNVLEELSLFDNRLTGSIPTELWRLSKLTDFVLHKNPSLKASLPEDFGLLMPQLELFQIESSQFTGSIPPSIGQCSNMVEFVMGGNQFTGSIPSEIGRLSYLEIFKASQNPLMQGTIPSELGLLTSLQELLIEGNPGIVGTIPEELTNLVCYSLKEFSIIGTSITGTIPEELCPVISFTCTNTTLCGCDCICS